MNKKRTNPNKKCDCTAKDIKKEELWDFIAGSIGFDRRGKEIQSAIRKFIELREKK